MTKRKSFSKIQITEHWQDKDHPFANAFVDACWICGWYSLALEKCHLIALFEGGADELDNLVLLCKNCHWATEGLAKKDLFWNYVKKTEYDLIGGILKRSNALGLLSDGDLSIYLDSKI